MSEIFHSFGHHMSAEFCHGETLYFGKIRSDGRLMLELDHKLGLGSRSLSPAHTPVGQRQRSGLVTDLEDFNSHAFDHLACGKGFWNLERSQA
jgi:hypothetical protein